MKPFDLFGAGELEEQKRKYSRIATILAVVFFILLLRLWDLQINRGGEFAFLSENNRIRFDDIPPPRGLILNRYGELLVGNWAAFNLAIIPEDVKDPKAVAKTLSGLVGLDETEILDKLASAKKRGLPRFLPVVIHPYMDWEEMVMVETRRYELPGVVVMTEPKRSYPQGKFASHLLGYLGEVSESELDTDMFDSYKVGELVGKSGAERFMEPMLRGIRGGVQKEVDAAGRRRKVLSSVDPVPGKDVYLTLDSKLQKTAQQALAGKYGAVVAMDVNNGDILALASGPTFDQEKFVRGFSPEEWKSLINDKSHPLQNRAVQGQYPPGSVFKVVIAAAALELGVATPQRSTVCTGEYRLGRRVYRCWRKKGHGRMNLRQAIVQSCDVYFYRLAEDLGVDAIAQYARKFGLGEPTGFPLAKEAPGLVPTKSWKLRRFGTPWMKGETLNTGIGQGFVLTTPIQIAVMCGALATGRVVRPRVVSKVYSPRGGEEVMPVVPSRPLGISEKTLTFMRDALVGVVNGLRGTGWRARIPGFTVAGKTGTAQVVSGVSEEGDEEVSFEMRDHALFVAYGPAESPEVVVACVIEHGGHGGTAAAPVVREVLKAYLKTRRAKEKT